jgi:hypothetical protein
MRCQVLYFSKIHSTPLPHHQKMGPRNHQKFNKCVWSSHAEPPPPSWSWVWCHVHDGPSHCKAVQLAILLSPLRQQINQLTHSLSHSLIHSTKMLRPWTRFSSHQTVGENLERDPNWFSRTYTFLGSHGLSHFHSSTKMMSVQNKGCVTLWPCHLH